MKKLTSGMKMQMQMDELITALKEIIETKGFDILDSKPYEIYQKISKIDTISDVISRILLITLLSGVLKQLRSDKMSQEELSDYLQKNCCLKKKMSDFMAQMYLSLFSDENIVLWRQKSEEGFREFCNSIWEFKWEGHSLWSADYVCMDCDCDAAVSIKIIHPDKVKKSMEEELQNNPFFSYEEICNQFSELLSTRLDNDFDFYCTSDEYYPPVVEDYIGNCEELIETFCKEHGMKLISFDFDGVTGDYY